LPDVQSGRVFRLPREVAREDFYIYDTDCLRLYRRWQRGEQGALDDSVPISFITLSELLIIRRCVVGGTEKSYYRWHGRKWHLLKRVVVGPPPPEPVQ
jgi:hypothetical protein